LDAEGNISARQNSTTSYEDHKLFECSSFSVMEVVPCSGNNPNYSLSSQG